MNLYRFLFFLLWGITANLFSQSTIDTAKQLPAIEITSSRLQHFTVGNTIQEIDSALLSKYNGTNLSYVLANESQIFIKSYGIGSLATTSFRGAGANHTAILWNGFNIQSPMNGLLDVALVPTNFLSAVKVQHGSAGALWGTGAVGGTVHLVNSPIFNKGITVYAGGNMGSFSDYKQQTGVEISKKNIVSSFKFFNHSAKNNFTFINYAQRGYPEQTQANAELKQHGFLQDNYFIINSKQKLSTHFWYQFNSRNIPPSMTQNISTANQQDALYRFTGEWERKGNKASVLIRSAYFNETNEYINHLIKLQAKHHTQVLITEAETRFNFCKLDLLNIGINNTYSKAVTSYYNHSPEQNRIALFASYKIHNPNNRIRAAVSVRQEFIETSTLPTIGSIGAEWEFLKTFTIKGNAAQHYRIPTFNDLYWAEGGNPNLKPESGWSEEAGIQHKHTYKKLAWELGATLFNRNINNWIIWLPGSLGMFSPENVMQVWSRGAEYTAKTSYTFNKWSFQLGGMYNYILSTNKKVAPGNESSLNKQLVYVPAENAQLNVGIQYHTLSVYYTQTKTGYRFTLSDNSAYLKPYTIGSIHLNHSLTFHRFKLMLSATINNIWKQSYQVIEDYPMPTLNYEFGATLYFNQPNKNNQ